MYLKHKIQVDAKKIKVHLPSLAVSSTGKSRIDNFFRPKKSCSSSPLLRKPKEHSVHVGSLLQNSGPA